MTKEKFNLEITTLKEFFECYCKNKHTTKINTKKFLQYKESQFELELYLCDDCLKDIEYCFDRLKECPHEEKPRCRKCPTPCYDKNQWKKTAKIMRYSGIRLGISKSINKLFKK